MGYTIVSGNKHSSVNWVANAIKGYKMNCEWTIGYTYVFIILSKALLHPPSLTGLD